MVTYPMTLTAPNPVFKVMTFFEVEYRKNINGICLKDKVTIAQTITNTWNSTMFGDLD